MGVFAQPGNNKPSGKSVASLVQIIGIYVNDKTEIKISFGQMDKTVRATEVQYHERGTEIFAMGWIFIR